MGQLPPNPLLMNAEHQDAPPPSSTSPRRSRAQETPSQTQQVQRLVEFGLINDSGLSSNANARKKKKKSVGFEELGEYFLLLPMHLRTMFRICLRSYCIWSAT